MTAIELCKQCGRKVRQGITAEGRNVALDYELPVYTPIVLHDREGRAREELVRSFLHLAFHRCPNRGDHGS